MSGITGTMFTLQLALLAALISIVLSGAVPPSAKNGELAAGHMESLEKPKEAPTVAMLAPQFQNPLQRSKRYSYKGWGRRPGLRYSKATSDFDAFNRIYNKYEKRGSESDPRSSFRELRMKQKVPNAQLLLPHLFNRNNRIPPPGALELDAPLPGSGSDIGILDVDGGPARLTEEDVDALMFLLEDYAKSIRNNDDQQ